MELKHLENSCIALSWSQGFQKGIICWSFNDKSGNQQKALGAKYYFMCCRQMTVAADFDQ